METAGLNVVCEFDGVARAVDVGPLLILRAGGEIVYRRQMEQVVDLALEALQVFGRDAQVGLGQVADDRNHPLVVDAPGLAQRRKLFEGTLAHQQIDRVAVLEQVLDEKTADEPGSARNEISHRVLPWDWCTGGAAGMNPDLPLSGDTRDRTIAHVAGIIRRGVGPGGRRH